MTEPPRPVARIREADCIGCTKCIQACPVDAILGSARKMHTVIIEECIGCKLCLPPCPVDCIDLEYPSVNPSQTETSAARKERAAHIKKRYTARQKRLQNSQEQQYPSLASLIPGPQSSALEERKAYVQQALIRIKQKRNP